MAKLKPAVEISSKKSRAKVFLTQLNPEYLYPVDICDLPPGIYTINGRKAKYHLDVVKSSLPLKKELNDKQDYIDVAKFKKLTTDYLTEGYGNLSHSDTEGILHDAHWIKHNPKQFSKEVVIIAKLIMQSYLPYNHKVLTDALKGDLYTKDMNRTNKDLTDCLKKVGRLPVNKKSKAKFMDDYMTGKLDDL